LRKVLICAIILSDWRLALGYESGIPTQRAPDPSTLPLVAGQAAGDWSFADVSHFAQAIFPGLSSRTGCASAFLRPDEVPPSTPAPQCPQGHANRPPLKAVTPSIGSSGLSEINCTPFETIIPISHRNSIKFIVSLAG
jgi:hypothetical protein